MTIQVYLSNIYITKHYSTKEIIIGDIDVNAIKLDSAKQQKRIEYIFKSMQSQKIFLI